jgi:branched-chain amino acid transport system permease protein
MASETNTPSEDDDVQMTTVRSNEIPEPAVGESDVALENLLSGDRLELRHYMGLLGLFTLAAIPTILTPLQLAPFIGIIFLMMFAISWDIVSGYTGQLSFGHAYFFALGGYATTILNLQHGIFPLVSIPLATLIAGLGGLIIGFPALRLRGPYLSLVTLVVPVIMLQIFEVQADEFVLDIGPLTVPIAPDGFGGTIGLSSPDALISTADAAVFTVSSYATEVLLNYYLALILLVLFTLLMLAITKSNTGDIFTAIRANEDVVPAVGINPAKFKLFAFVVSGMVGGFAAAVFVHTLAGVAQPASILNVGLSIDVIIYSVLGGMGTIVGPILGVVFFEGSIQLLESFETTIFGVALDDLAPLLLYIVSIVVVIKRPQGLLPALLQFGRRVRARFKDEPAPGETQKEETPVYRTLKKFYDELQEIANRVKGP